MIASAGYLHWVRNRWRMRAFPGARPQRGGVMLVLFHGLFRSQGEAASGLCDPQQGITAGFFREFVETLLEQGVTIRELESALRRPQEGLSAVITFDDGYFNNAHALAVLEEFGVPATFFISTRHVEEQKSFWWDALYREARKRGTTTTVIRRQLQTLKRLRADEIESCIVQWFGTRALRPVSDCDRPFTTSELVEFARSRYVFLGNHTSDHAILVNYDAQGMRDQILGAQEFLTGVSGTAPKSIAYPNGNYDDRVLQTARDTGLEFGLTLRTGLNFAAALRPLELRRLTLWGVPSAARQGRVFGGVSR
jgi:peptidoglycan/xylan/chitin deacetylase (PgdA/CDA1 family)